MCRRKLIRAATTGLTSLALAAGIALLGVTPTSADQSPAGCLGNLLNLGMLKDKTTIDSGETVTFTVPLANDSAMACDVTGATATFRCPAADGTPTGAPVACGPANSNYPVPTPAFILCVVPCTVAFNPGVTSAQAKVSLTGVLHDNVTDDALSIERTLSVTVDICGDGIIGNTPNETCDPPGQPGGANGNTCRENCTVCGDGILD